MIDVVEYEEIGVTLSLDRKGRTNAHRVFVTEGKVVKRETLTEGRNSSKALEEALQSMGLVIHQVHRGELALVQPEAIKMLLEHK